MGSLLQYTVRNLPWLPLSVRSLSAWHVSLVRIPIATPLQSLYMQAASVKSIAQKVSPGTAFFISQQQGVARQFYSESLRFPPHASPIPASSWNSHLPRQLSAPVLPSGTSISVANVQAASSPSTAKMLPPSAIARVELPSLSRPFSASAASQGPLPPQSGPCGLSPFKAFFRHPPAAPSLSLRHSFASGPPASGPQSWVARLRMQTRSAVAQPRNLAAGVSEKGAAAFDSLTGAGARYRQALGLQLAGFWNRNSLLLFGALGLAVILILWRIMFGVASIFLNFSEWMADLGFLALASSMVLLTGLYLRRRMTINPDSVYRQVMRQVNTFPSALEVLGAPLTGSDVRAYVMSGGGIRMRGLTPKFSTKRAYLIFPIRGSERRGLVSVEAKKRHGKYEYKLISVDVPTASGLAEQRLYLIGDEAAYRKAGTLINELRDPIIQAMAMESQFEAEDDQEDEDEVRAKRAEETRKFEQQLADEAEKLQAEAEAREREEEAAKAAAKTP